MILMVSVEVEEKIDRRYTELCVLTSEGGFTREDIISKLAQEFNLTVPEIERTLKRIFQAKSELYLIEVEKMIRSSLPL
jgi:uncharacterized protein YqfB (UPF0267 family)